MTALSARTIAADIMCGNARSITVGEIWAHIGQAYDTDEPLEQLVDEVAELIGKAGIDLLWLDGTKDTESDAARVEIERRDAELAKVREVVEAAKDVTKAYRAEGGPFLVALARLDAAVSLADHSCPSCAPGYDCERGIYTPGGA